MTRRIAIVTVGRSDFGIYLPLLRALSDDPACELFLIAAGAHLSSSFGNTVDCIQDAGFEVRVRVPMLIDSDTPEAIASSIGTGILKFSTLYPQMKPHVVVLLGDRFEMLAAAVAALPFALPLAHIHGGELSEGAIDDAIRHALTKLSHLHFASAEPHAMRIVQMGEEPWRVTISGAPSLDNLASFRALEREWFQEHYGIRLPQEFLLVTYHPVTLEYQKTEFQVTELLEALREIGRPVVITYPNADTGSRGIIELIEAFPRTYSKAHVVQNLGTQAYFSLMSYASAMVGNSSSGIIEAASFKLPVVNIGDRQKGRYHGANVIHVGNRRDEIATGIARAVSVDFKRSLRDLENPYARGGAAKIILQKLRDTPLDARLMVKRFYSIESPQCCFEPLSRQFHEAGS